MNQRLLFILAFPGVVLGVLIMLGILQNLFLLALIWLFIAGLYPFIIVADMAHMRLFHTFLAVFICGSFIFAIPVEWYPVFYKNNPERIDVLNYTYRHPRRMMFAIGEVLVLFSGLISVIITDVLIGLRRASLWYP